MPGAIHILEFFQPTPAFQRSIARWLSLCILLVVCMVALGGVTRLTESGLSIVEWKLVSGTVPPLTDTAWQREFDQYKTSPQYQQVNRDFSVADFKRIFWLEYAHRLLGRVIGLVIVFGTIYFSIRRRFTPRLTRRMVAICTLVAAQGGVGWVMVASGLVDAPRVAPIKLAAHLLLAFGLYAALLWTRWQVLGQPRPACPRALAAGARLLLSLVIIQLIFGALVAGLRAGLSYNSYPLMDGQLIPDGLHTLVPWWRNHLESILTVQFQHRMGAIIVAIGAFAFIRFAWKKTEKKALLRAMGIVIGLQFTLGVATLLSHVNITLASAHQVVALLLVGLLVRALYIFPYKNSRNGLRSAVSGEIQTVV